ncbi:type II toxin-antitoxin system VapB family antitoxin [Nocardia sp. NPDC058176]|uniref:type II toxin-antitoxin system VapB family antitoxin n=1 Tax=Nocardia sp. NPDC058176 TaxID=3346368 RepID=UPI0036DC0B0F
MRTLRIDLDQHLLAAAADIMGTADSNATVNEALRRIVVHERQLRNLERLMADSVFSRDQSAREDGAADPGSVCTPDRPVDGGCASVRRRSVADSDSLVPDAVAER